MGDYSCYITLNNNTSLPLDKTSENIVDGYWATNPPSSIAPNSTGTFQLKDNLGPTGSEGFVTYAFQTPSQPVNVSLHFSCPVWSSNIYTDNISNPRVVTAVDQSSGPHGHPLTASSTYTDAILESFGLAGVVSSTALRTLESSNFKDHEAWKQAEKEMTEMKNAERWTVAK